MNTGNDGASLFPSMGKRRSQTLLTRDGGPGWILRSTSGLPIRKQTEDSNRGNSPKRQGQQVKQCQNVSAHRAAGNERGA